MFVNDTSGGNGGVAFHIQDVRNTATSGHYYAISLFPASYSSEHLAVNLGKWNNSVNNQYQLAQYRLNNTWTPGGAFDIKIETFASSSSLAIKTTINDMYLGKYLDTDDPFLYGSVGMRNYKLPSKFMDIFVDAVSI